MIGQADTTAKFEEVLSGWVDGAGGVAVGSGAGAILLALTALGVKAGDEILLPTYVCTSVAEAVISAGARPVLCDVGKDWILTPETVASSLTPKTKVIIAPHLYGIYADISGIKRLGLPVIEDCAQAVGMVKQHAIQGDLAVFSFHPTKCLSTGEGGMVVGRDPKVISKLSELRDGSGDAVKERFFSPLSNMASALGLSQLARYQRGLDRRVDIAQRYKRFFEEILPSAINHDALSNSMYFRFPIVLKGGLDKCVDQFYQRGIIVRRGVDRLIHRVKGQPDSTFPNACELFATTVSLPIYPSLTEKEVGVVIKACQEIINLQGL